MSIHQEVTIDAPPSKVYKALVDADEFAAFSGMPAEIDATEGGSFSCFGTFIVGRNIELVPNRRVVQAWRVFNWPEGVYSIATFDLSEAAGGKTKLVFDQSGVPESEAEHIEQGWPEKYWQPLRKHLES